MNNKETSNFCPIRDVLSRVGDKWSMLVMMTIYRGETMRFKEINREIPDLSEKVLTSTLRALESDGYLSRKIYPQVPPKVEYKLTDMGKSLVPLLQNLVDWALNQGNQIIMNREQKSS
ncbi:MAG: helix-turn-helix domain-containing protein [Rikenellaceae bacterium]